MELIVELDQYQSSLYPPESNHLESIEKLASPRYYFIAACDNQHPVGIASFKRSSRNHVELKRLYVARAKRGIGLAEKLVMALEQQARQEGFSAVKLETGIHQREAISLYGKLGYKKTDPFGFYTSDPLSVFMSKQLR